MAELPPPSLYSSHPKLLFLIAVPRPSEKQPVLQVKDGGKLKHPGAVRRELRRERTSKLDLTSSGETWQWLLPHYQERGAGRRQSEAGIPVLGTLLHRGQMLEGRNDRGGPGSARGQPGVSKSGLPRI